MALEVLCARCGQKTCGNKREMRHPKRAKRSLMASEASKAKKQVAAQTMDHKQQRVRLQVRFRRADK